jgi:hypothetical protein
MEFLPKGLKPYKFKRNSNWFYFLNFQFRCCWESKLLPKRKVVAVEVIYHLVKFGKIWRKGVTTFVFFKFGVAEVLEKDIETMELGPAYCYSPDPAGPPSQLLHHACVTLSREADRCRCHSPTSPPWFPRRLFVDWSPRSHAAHRRRGHGPSPPTVSPHVCRLSDVDHTAGFIHVHCLLPRCPPFPRQRPQAFTVPRACPPSDLIFRMPGLWRKGRFLHLPAPIFAPPLSPCPALLSAATCCCVKPSEQLAVHHPVPGSTQHRCEGHLRSWCLSPCFPMGAPSSPGILGQPQSRPAPHWASLSPRKAPRPRQLHQRPPANLPQWRAPSAKVHHCG